VVERQTEGFWVLEPAPGSLLATLNVRDITLRNFGCSLWTFSAAVILAWLEIACILFFQISRSFTIFLMNMLWWLRYSIASAICWADTVILCKKCMYTINCWYTHYQNRTKRIGEKKLLVQRLYSFLYVNSHAICLSKGETNKSQKYRV